MTDYRCPEIHEHICDFHIACDTRECRLAAASVNAAELNPPAFSVSLGLAIAFTDGFTVAGLTKPSVNIHGAARKRRVRYDATDCAPQPIWGPLGVCNS